MTNIQVVMGSTNNSGAITPGSWELSTMDQNLYLFYTESNGVQYNLMVPYVYGQRFAFSIRMDKTANTMSFWMNGTKLNKTIVSSMPDSNYPVILSSLASGNGSTGTQAYGLRGTMHALRVYQSALIDAEVTGAIQSIRNLYNC